MNRPNWKDYDTPDNCSVIAYGTKLDKYHSDLEKYCDELERRTKVYDDIAVRYYKHYIENNESLNWRLEEIASHNQTLREETLNIWIRQHIEDALEEDNANE